MSQIGTAKFILSLQYSVENLKSILESGSRPILSGNLFEKGPD
jgi:hypothetical protein